MTKKELRHLFDVLSCLTEADIAILQTLLKCDDNRFTLLDFSNRFGLTYKAVCESKKRLQDLGIIYCSELDKLELPEGRGSVSTFYEFFVNFNLKQWGHHPDV